MSALSIQPAYPIFTDLKGEPLESGYIWIGQANLDPRVNPIAVYWDSGLTIPAVQPIRTLDGYPSNAGTPARLYVDSDYSIRVMDKKGSVVYSAPQATERYSGVITSVDAENVSYTPPFSGGIKTNAELKFAQYVSVLDFIPAVEHAAIQDGTSTFDCTTYIQTALDESDKVFASPGLYNISRPLLMNRAGQVFFGAGTQSTTLRALPGFAGTTVGGSVGSAMIWYQAPGTWTNADWIEGGRISDMAIWGNSVGVEGVRINRVTSGHVFRNLRIVDCTIGIYGTKWGWITEFDNVYVLRATITAIRLLNGYNGCTFNNCFLYGGDIDTPVLLDIGVDCYGNSYTGGAIEGCLVGVRLTNAQIAFNGTDFEVNKQKFFEIKGIYDPGLVAANPTVTITGCTFVGVPLFAGIEVTGGAAEVHGNFFINSGAAPGAGVYCMKGIAGADVTVIGFERLCISESNNVARGWNGQITTGLVFSRFTSIAAGSTSVNRLQVGDTSSRLGETSVEAARLVGKSWIPQQFGYVRPAFNADTLQFSIVGLGDVNTQDARGFNGYVGSAYGLDTNSLKFYANDQAGGPQTTYGKSVLSAGVTTLNNKVRDYAVWADSMLSAIRPNADSAVVAHSLGTASYRWSTVFAATGTINTSDVNEKQQIRVLDAKEKAVAVKLKGLIKAFKFNDAVAEKGDGARIHVGAIAQEVEQAFISEGLDPEKYAVFCRDVWFTIDGQQTLGEAGAVRHERLGLRYEQLLAFIITTI